MPLSVAQLGLFVGQAKVHSAAKQSTESYTHTFGPNKAFSCQE